MRFWGSTLQLLRVQTLHCMPPHPGAQHCLRWCRQVTGQPVPPVPVEARPASGGREGASIGGTYVVTNRHHPNAADLAIQGSVRAAVLVGDPAGVAVEGDLPPRWHRWRPDRRQCCTQNQPGRNGAHQLNMSSWFAADSVSCVPGCKSHSCNANMHSMWWASHGAPYLLSRICCMRSSRRC